MKQRKLNLDEEDLQTEQTTVSHWQDYALFGILNLLILNVWFLLFEPIQCQNRIE